MTQEVVSSAVTPPRPDVEEKVTQEPRQIHMEVKLVPCNPGDQLLVLLPPGADENMCNVVAQQLQARFPEVGFFILSGIIGVGIMPPSKSKTGLILPQGS